MTTKTQLVLTDPRAIRALAHPARQVIIDELYGGRVLTATECAELAGLTPSATSYHLRALERWGIVERADSSGDGRERPWQAVGSGLRIETQTSTAGRLASQSIMRVAVDQTIDLFDQMPADDPWDDVSQMSRGRFWLTHAEARELSSELQALMDRYKLDRSQDERPEGTRAIHTLFAVVPSGEAPQP